MRIFLDTNVVLTGALNSRGPARALAALIGRATFVFSPQVLAECDYLIRRDAATPLVAQVVQKTIRSFLEALGALQVPDVPPPQGVSALDDGDSMLLGAALSAQADTICTYNVKDFPASYINVRTPLAIHRSIAEPTLEQYIQPIVLSVHGTLLFFGRLHHESSMGTILESDGQVEVIADERGFIRLTGSSAKRCRSIKPLRGNNEFHLTLRYNGTDFEAALWNKDSGAWKKDVITTGVASFSEATRPILCFVPNHRFSGHIQCISGLPRFVRDKQMPAALDNYSLEASAGSLDLRRFLRAVVIQ
jgi:predicted nucleic acid-binding protein